MKSALKYKSKNLRNNLNTNKLFKLFNKTLLNNLNNLNTKKKFKTLNLLIKKETPRNLCILTNKSRNINRLIKTSGTSMKQLITRRELSGFIKSSW